MILDLPPETIQAIITKAQMQGITPAQMLSHDYGNYVDDLMADQAGLFSPDETDGTLTDKQAQFILDILDNPPPLSKTAQAFLKGERV